MESNGILRVVQCNLEHTIGALSSLNRNRGEAIYKSGAVLRCEIFNEAGRQKGTSTGVLYQTSHPAGTIHIAPGDTTRLKLFHLMDREVTGVTDVGIKVYGRHQSSGN